MFLSANRYPLRRNMRYAASSQVLVSARALAQEGDSLTAEVENLLATARAA